MIARKCLISLGYIVVGAFTSTQVTTKSNPKNNVSSVDKYNEMLRDSECHGRKWIQLAPRSIKARNHHEFLRQMKSEMTLSGCYGQYECFSVVDFKAELKAHPAGDGMIILTQNHMEQEYARSKFTADMITRDGLLIVVDRERRRHSIED